MQDCILKIKKVSEIVGVSPSTIRRLYRRGLFPPQVCIPGTTRKGWSLNEINQYLKMVKEAPTEQPLIRRKTWRTNNL